VNFSSDSQSKAASMATLSFHSPPAREPNCCNISISVIIYRFPNSRMYSLSVTKRYPFAFRSEISSGIIAVVDDNS